MNLPHHTIKCMVTTEKRWGRQLEWRVSPSAGLDSYREGLRMTSWFVIWEFLVTWVGSCSGEVGKKRQTAGRDGGKVGPWMQTVLSRNLAVWRDELQEEVSWGRKRLKPSHQGRRTRYCWALRLSNSNSENIGHLVAQPPDTLLIWGIISRWQKQKCIRNYPLHPLPPT